MLGPVRRDRRVALLGTPPPPGPRELAVGGRPRTWASSGRELWRHSSRHGEPRGDVSSGRRHTGREPGPRSMWRRAESRGRRRPGASRCPRGDRAPGPLGSRLSLLLARAAVCLCPPRPAARGLRLYALRVPAARKPRAAPAAPLPSLELGGGPASASLPCQRLESISGEERALPGWGLEATCRRLCLSRC